MKKIIRTILAVFAFVLLSTNASIADDSIFSQITFKVTDTLLDLQKVIYIIGGFGLIAFAFAAVFGKISFRHLAYLSFSLFLVAAMGGFVRYITGDNRALSALVYVNHIVNGGGTVPDVPTDSGTTPDCNGDPECENGGDSYIINEDTECPILEEACMHGNIQACNQYNGCDTNIDPTQPPNNPNEPSYSCSVFSGIDCDELEYVMDSTNCPLQQTIQAQRLYLLQCAH